MKKVTGTASGGACHLFNYLDIKNGACHSSYLLGWFGGILRG